MTNYREWEQDNGLYVNVAGNVDYGPPEPEDDDGRCVGCGAEIGHYNGCMEDPDAMCLCHLCMGDQAVTSETECPFHGKAGDETTGDQV